MKIAKRNPRFNTDAQRLALTLQYVIQGHELPRGRLFQRWVNAALLPATQETIVTLRIVGEEEGRSMNRDYRGKDYATNVLTFALHEGEERLPGMPLIGDIVLCAPVVEREAAEQNKTLEEHYAHLTVHGMLHLQGLDHIEEDEAEAMEALESALLGKLGYADPYAVEKS